jgi:hypothetical protein
MRKACAIFILSFLFCPFFASATNMFDVVINEIAWMGTASSSNDEWMELKNNTGAPIDLSGWTLQTADEKIKISLTGAIPANEFYLLERTDDNTVPDITADQIYTGALSNNGQDLWLYDGNNNIIDEADFYAGWTAGDNATKQTIERIDNNNWQTSKDVGGTPKTQNGSGTTEVSNNEQKTNPTPNTQNPTPNITYPSGILLNEILPNPEGSDETDEWIELYNSNNFDVDLSGWKIQDTAGTITTFTIPKHLPDGRQANISAGGFLVFKRPDTKIMLNNDEDGLNILTPDNQLIDSAEYTKAPLGQSYNKTNSGWQWSATLTPESKNIISAPAGVKNSSKTLSKTQKPDKNNTVEPGLAGISQSTNTNQNYIKNQNPWFLFFAALALTIISAVIVLLIKIRLKGAKNLTPKT